MTIDTKKTKATITSAVLLSSIMMLTIQVIDTEYSFNNVYAGSFPAIIEGDILVGIEDLLGGGPRSVLINPTTGSQSVYTSSIHIIIDMKGDASGDIIVAHEDGVSRVDTVTGGETSLAVSGDNFIESPLGMDLNAAGDIIVLDDDGGNGLVISVDPITGAETLIIIEAILAGSDDIAVDSSGDILILNGGVIYKVDPIAGTQTLFASDVMGGTDRMTINAAGDIFTAGFEVVKIDPITAAPTLISSGYGQISGIGVESDGNLILVDTDADPIVYRVDPISGAQTVLSSDNLFTGTIASTLAVFSVAGAPPPAATCQGQTVTIIGTEFSDIISGTAGDDVIDGLDGDDVINGQGGNDIICGGGGDDFIDAGLGNDVVRGNGGKDVIVGNEGNDVLKGDGGKDNINGGSGNDTIEGGSGDDILIGGSEDDDMDGGDDVDLCDNEINDTVANCEMTTT